ncbi:hypothetical protein K492DRAFT_197480 [Lichtheimia hyalospora FSU 10163]|nr:hypothetical protein K492DRAFT_197480 [Lichtheimia hyalospora FSU 10163]
MSSKSFPGTRKGPTFDPNRSSHQSTFSCPLPMFVPEHDDQDSNMKSSSGLQVEHNEHATCDTIHHNDNETFGDILSHSVSQFHQHQLRMHSYRRQVEEWEYITNQEHDRSQHAPGYSVVVHFRKLKGHQSFALTPTQVKDFATKLHLTQQERIRFNGVHDTDSLMDYLHKIKRDYSIKVHHLAADNYPSIEFKHNPDIIELNDNVYIEFRLREPSMLPLPAVEITRRPFFRHPDPDLSANIGQEKSASWLELFYDLVYVASLTEFTHTHVIKDFESLGTYTEWFIITWWAWFASSLYSARFNTDDVVHHIWKLIEMCAVITMASTSTYFFTSSSYVYGYIALKSVLVIEYAVVLVIAISTRSRASIPLAFYVGANIVSIILWASSLAVLDESTHRILWYTGILVEILVNVISRRDRALSWAASNLAERLGLLTLIVLGENLIGLIALVALSGSIIWVTVANWFAVIIIFGFFFMYFEDFNKNVFLHSKFHQIWVYLHFPLHLCQIAFGIELINMLKLYRSELIDDGYLSSSTENTKVSSEESTADPEAYNLARRAIEAIPSNVPHISSNTISLNSTEFKSPQTTSMTLIGYFTLFKYAASVTTLATLQGLNTDRLLSASSIHDEGDMSTQTLHAYARRAPGESGLENDYTREEMVFIYKLFLIMGGLLLVLNSMIKLINTRVTDIYGRIIICSRIVNAAVLWCLCALPFSGLHPLILIGVTMGSIVLQGIVDLLD